MDNKLEALSILDALGDGVYATDLERRITYWSPAAERITGWKSEEVMGKSCRDNILCHTDKDGKALCGHQNCPLYRAMKTGENSKYPVIVFAKGREGGRIPMQVNVSPVKNSVGEVVGGVEVFRDLTHLMTDLNRAREIQRQSLLWELADDYRVEFDIHYIPHDMVGGDFYAAETLDEDHCVFMVADVMGHGVASALYTMQLRSLWEENREKLMDPAQFLMAVNQKLHNLTRENHYFATVGIFCFDILSGVLTYAGAGHGPALVLSQSGEFREIELSGLPLGMMGESSYVNQELQLIPGDRLFLFTDGLNEAPTKNNEELGLDGVKSILLELGYPEKSPHLGRLFKSILAASDQVSLPDDFTMMTMRYFGN